jgi:protein-S-isoprenylcysteine O-methyltransferase Ste14
MGVLRLDGGWPVNQPTDAANVVIHPPIALALAVLVGLGLDWLFPLPFVPVLLPHIWIGLAIFALAFGLAIWAIATFRRAGTRIETNLPTSTIVTSGPYRFARNPIYLGMLLGQIGLAIAFNTLWILSTLVPFFLVLRYGVVAREEVYLDRKFGDEYRRYVARVRRWL